MAAHSIVPTVDVATTDAGQLAAVDRACADHGFFLLTGHGLDDVIADTWRAAQRFFAADRATKTAIMRDHENPLGYFDRELTKRRRDHKEVFDFTDPADAQTDRHNRWPSGDGGVGGGFDGEAFRHTMVAFYDAFSELATATTQLVHRALGLDPHSSGPDGIARFHGDRRRSSVRLNHYPLGDPVPAGERAGLQSLGDTALGYHTDPGVLTLLLQDDTGGLQAQTADGGWVDIVPQEGTVVVNMADAMQVWTNDRYRAAVHRVVPMTRTDRMSIPYFLNPARDAVIEPIPALAADAPLYVPFEWSAYMRARNEDNFEDLGADDAQISDYRTVT